MLMVEIVQRYKMMEIPWTNWHKVMVLSKHQWMLPPISVQEVELDDRRIWRMGCPPVVASYLEKIKNNICVHAMNSRYGNNDNNRSIKLNGIIYIYIYMLIHESSRSGLQRSEQWWSIHPYKDQYFFLVDELQ
jgi:hypothetical protein